VEKQEEERLLAGLVQRAQGDDGVVAVILFGSASRGERHPGSDLDICLVLQPGDYTPSALAEKRLDYPADFPLDIGSSRDFPSTCVGGR